MTDIPDRRQSAPAALRNRDPILEVLRTVLPERGTVLEVASGTGEHIVHFARALPRLDWQPSDPSEEARRSIDAWAAAEGAGNVAPALEIDASRPRWPVAHADAILCINMVHISPWAATEGLMCGAGALLPVGAPLYLYGPFRRADAAFAPSNAAFDDDLRRRNPEWGVRQLEDVALVAKSCGLMLDRTVEMPANNLSVIFRRA